jgi:glutathione S-transferase
MKLYYSPGACSLAPHIALREAGLPFEAVLASTKTKKLQDGTDFLTINPKGQVPVLELDDGARLTEVQVLLQLIASLAPAAGLVPTEGLARWRQLEWLNFCATEVHKGFSPLFTPGMPEEAKALARERLLGRAALIEAALADAPFVGGDHLTAADIYLWVATGWGPYVGVDFSAFPKLMAWRARIGERPAVVAALKAEGLIK